MSIALKDVAIVSMMHMQKVLPLMAGVASVFNDGHLCKHLP